MKLKPFEEQIPGTEAIVKADVAALFGSGGKSNQKLEMDEIRGLFDSHGAGVKDVALTLGNILKSSDEDGHKLKASEQILKVHGIFKDVDEKAGQQIVINVVGNDNNTMINLLCPQGN